MKTIFLCRDSVAARYIANRLAQRGELEALVVESGAEARRRKLKRTFRDASWWQIPSRCIDLTAVALYGARAERRLVKQLLAPPETAGFPTGIELHRVVDGNDGECVETLKRYAPDVLLVFGTSILKPHVLEIPSGYALNIHGGIVPAYRNVHCDFWALYRRDLENVGVSIIHLDPGIDSGDVALQGRVEVTAGDSIFKVKARLTQLAADLALEALRQAREGTLPRQPQDSGDSGFYRTPTARQLVELFLRSR
jgi:methionyl-tRNA formyltransferase